MWVFHLRILLIQRPKTIYSISPQPSESFRFVKIALITSLVGARYLAENLKQAKENQMNERTPPSPPDSPVKTNRSKTTIPVVPHATEQFIIIIIII